MLELKHIKKSFDGVPVLKNINLEIEDGEIVPSSVHQDVEKQHC